LSYIFHFSFLISHLTMSFHPLIQSWFDETYGKPTAVQAGAWPLIEKGDHVLALAPTGSGKTLTAFLSAISRFCGGVEAQSLIPTEPCTLPPVSPVRPQRSRPAKAGLPFL
jgi:reverse gyrase